MSDNSIDDPPSSSGRQPDVVVVGSLNVDSTVAVDSIPVPGETVIGGPVQSFMGGKGLNQAVAAARAGAEVAMVGRIGDDDGGRRLRAYLADEGIDHSAVSIDPDIGSGAAFIAVDGNGENAIVVSPAANAGLSVDHIDAAADIISSAAVVLIQLEVPMDAVTAAVAVAAGTVILNPAPAQDLPDDVLKQVDILIPNRTELATISARPEPSTMEEVVAAATSLADRMTGPRSGRAAEPGYLIVTVGAEGSVLVDLSRGSYASQRPPAVNAVDTTGAGDCFCGSLAARLALDDDLDTAVRYALTAAAVSVTRPGAADSIPGVDEVLGLLSDGKI